VYVPKFNFFSFRKKFYSKYFLKKTFLAHIHGWVLFAELCKYCIAHSNIPVETVTQKNNLLCAIIKGRMSQHKEYYIAIIHTIFMKPATGKGLRTIWQTISAPADAKENRISSGYVNEPASN
jgi:hypothetical protein